VIQITEQWFVVWWCKNVCFLLITWKCTWIVGWLLLLLAKCTCNCGSIYFTYFIFLFCYCSVIHLASAKMCLYSHWASRSHRMLQTRFISLLPLYLSSYVSCVNKIFFCHNYVMGPFWDNCWYHKVMVVVVFCWHSVVPIVAIFVDRHTLQVQGYHWFRKCRNVSEFDAVRKC